MRKLYSILISVLLYTGMHAQQWNWVKSDAASDTYATSRIASYNGGLVYASYAHMIHKYNSEGQLLWSKGIDNIHIYDIACTSSGDFVIAGSFTDTAIIGTQTIISFGEADMFLARFTPEGNALWALSYGDIGDDIVHSISLDLSGNILLAAEFEGTIVIGNTSLNANGYHSMVTAKFSISGEPAWAKQSSGSNGRPVGIKTDSAGNAYIISLFELPVNFEQTTVISSSGYPKGSNVLVKYGPSGQLIWALFKGDAQYGGMDEISDDKSGFIYTSWDSRYITSSIYKFNSDGELIWSNSVGEASYTLRVHSLYLSDENHLYVSGVAVYDGYVCDSLPWGMFVVRWDTSASCQWMIYGTSTGIIMGGGIAKGDLSDVYVSGTFDDTATFGGINLYSQQLRSLYVARINDIPIGVQEEDDNAEELLVYPNPTDHILFIQYKNLESSGRVQVQIKNAMGQLVHSNVYNSFRSVLQISIDLGTHPKGVYFVEVDSGVKRFIRRVVIN